VSDPVSSRSFVAVSPTGARLRAQSVSGPASPPFSRGHSRRRSQTYSVLPRPYDESAVRSAALAAPQFRCPPVAAGSMHTVRARSGSTPPTTPRGGYANTPPTTPRIKERPRHWSPSLRTLAATATVTAVAAVIFYYFEFNPLSLSNINSRMYR